MSANVETLFYAGREKCWHGLGTQIDEAPTSADALVASGLDWTVESRPVFTKEGLEIPNYRANVRTSDDSILGVVSDRYKIVQNVEAFEFLDNLVDGAETRYETAGSLRNGRTVWMLAKLPETRVLGEEVDPFICFTNTHDGTGAIRACMTPVRVVCNNTLNLALSTASRTWSIKHIGNIDSRLYEAETALGLANTYMKALDEEAEKLANIKLDDGQISNILSELFPIADDAGEIAKRRAQAAKDNVMVCYFMPDIKQYLGTGYGLANAVADFVDHAAPMRMTENYRINNFERVVIGHPILDKALKLVRACA